jgi:hypothetical protein
MKYSAKSKSNLTRFDDFVLRLIFLNKLPVILKILKENNIEADKLLLPIYEQHIEKYLSNVEKFSDLNKDNNRFELGFNTAKVIILQFLL